MGQKGYCKVTGLNGIVKYKKNKKIIALFSKNKLVVVEY